MIRAAHAARILVAALALLGGARPAAAAPLALEAGNGRVVALSGAAASVFAADPKVAEVRPASPTSLFIFGVAPGRTTVAALSAAGRAVGYFEVVVRPSAHGAAETGAAIRRTLPGRDVRAEPTGNGLELSGTVGTAGDAEQAARLARGFLTEKQVLANRLQVQSGVQVNLRVRIAEMSRTLTRELGVNWQALGSLGRYGAIGFATANPLTFLGANAASLGAGYAKASRTGFTDVNAMIDALSQDQLVRILAEPNLTTMSGEPASFLAGGEFPIPVAQELGRTTIEFKQYGISLAFVPTVVGADRISIQVRPEVSQLSNEGGIRFGDGNNSIQVPGLTVRRAETTVELGSGQSFAIAGLLQDTSRTSGVGLPFLGDVPVLGALFRSSSFQRNETELVIIVTPYLVQPVSDPAALRRPDDGWRPPSDLERILLLRQTPLGGGGAVPTAVRIPGDAGFVVQ